MGDFYENKIKTNKKLCAITKWSSIVKILRRTSTIRFILMKIYRGITLVKNFLIKREKNEKFNEIQFRTKKLI